LSKGGNKVAIKTNKKIGKYNYCRKNKTIGKKLDGSSIKRDFYR